MTAKEFVKNRYPRATVLRYKSNGPLSKGYNLCWTKRYDGTRLSEGNNESEAWKNAKEAIKTMDIYRESRIKEIDIRIDELEEIIDKKDKEWFEKLYAKAETLSKLDYIKEVQDTHKDYIEFLNPENDEIGKLNRERRKIQPYKFSEFPMIGNVYSLKEFVSLCECGGFINYDGFGYYMKDGKETDIMIYPSDVKNGIIRDDEFDTMVWLNS